MVDWCYTLAVWFCMLVSGTPYLSGFVGRLVSGMYTPSVWFCRQAGKWYTLFGFAYWDNWYVKLCIPCLLGFVNWLVDPVCLVL